MFFRTSKFLKLIKSSIYENEAYYKELLSANKEKLNDKKELLEADYRQLLKMFNDRFFNTLLKTVESSDIELYNKLSYMQRNMSAFNLEEYNSVIEYVGHTPQTVLIMLCVAKYGKRPTNQDCFKADKYSVMMMSKVAKKNY